MKCALIVEDEQIIALDLEMLVSNLGYRTTITASGDEAVTAARTYRPDLVLMDLRLDGSMDGIQTAVTLRAESEAQIIFVTAFCDKETIQRAIAVNPAGYLVKPFNELTLTATIQLAMANRERLEAAGPQVPKLLRAGDVEIDLVRHRVFRQGAEVLLTRKEFRILACLAKQPDVPVSAEALLVEAWGPQYIHYVQALRVHVGNLRRKVESNSFPGVTIDGLRGVGYRLRENERSVAAEATNQPSDLVFAQG